MRDSMAMSVDVAPTAAIIPYDETLLERAKTQWQFGDWASLANMDRALMQHHPERANLALFAAAGQFQVGTVENARQYVHLAQEWGCGGEQLIRVLAAGVHNSLGRAAARGGMTKRAAEHFTAAVKVGTPGTDVGLVSRARLTEQFAQLGMDMPAVEVKEETAKQVVAPFGVHRVPGASPIAVDLLLADSEGGRERALAAFRTSFADIPSAEGLPGMAFAQAEHRGRKFHFVHLAGDLVPSKMAERGQFHEHGYLNLLARLHQPGKIIVDGGSGIGTHAVFFAGVLGAPVIAFEPQSFNYRCLLANVHLNEVVDKVDLRQVALAGEPGRIALAQVVAGDFGSFSSQAERLARADNKGLDASRFEISASTLNAELQGYASAISIIKLDVEGQELDVLRGATTIIAQSLPVIAVECSTRSQYENTKLLLAAFDYFVIDSTNSRPTFIFLTRRNPHHIQMLSKYLEMSSVGKFSSNTNFNDAKS
ncbi:hypothetical protein AW878_08945 [Bordetella pseudohinzii]|uniref:Methyltransferase FkbM domain-containing protein n=1 Tax=Bordetella pseudohinzii TaxID=1331258 RepID=A0ABM6DBA9_9BORD|nr:hypothetical protein BBN53_03530 [Bordetella pseudohinzii]KMM26080.1 hypothetical protein L540_16230 [Bordetella pseudohinzii]KXA79843.1 hypothetical protein AW878_08945 [Bordetella pseudohinzii]KXA82815.1 hypothetical protein AW877_01600 [Bordetella pseudohinzii]